MIQDSRFKIQEYARAIIPPFATASAALLLVLSFVEYFRRGFVSLFLDFRILIVATFVLWLAAILVEVSPRPRRFHALVVAFALVALAPILWRMAAPYGRLGLITFLCGLASLAIIFIASTRPANH